MNEKLKQTIEENKKRSVVNGVPSYMIIAKDGKPGREYRSHNKLFSIIPESHKDTLLIFIKKSNIAYEKSIKLNE